MAPALPDTVHSALDEIWAGATGDSQESAVLDFKEDPARISSRPTGRGNPDAAVAETLINECICFANGAGGEAYIVLGVSDKRAGPDAFSGTGRDTEWIERKVFDKTRPNLRVEVDSVDYRGHRLLIIRIPTGLSVYSRTDGAASRRIGTNCVPLTEHERRDLHFARANPDMTARASTLTADDLDPLAITRARALLAAKRRAVGDDTAVPEQTFALLRELGLTMPDGSLTVAAELLFTRTRTEAVSARYLRRAVPGGEPTVTDLDGALILVFDQVQDLVRRHMDTEIARVNLPGGQEVAIPAFPAKAVDEVLSNALVHRDWTMTSSIVVDQSPRILKVWSPGPLPFGVTSDHLLTTRSVPRNNRLMAGMRALGLAEESSRGFDRMWSAMLSTGRAAPEVEADDFHVGVTLVASRPDTAFIAGLARLRSRYGADTIDAVNTLIVLKHLSKAPLMTLRQVTTQTQTGSGEALQIMEWLTDVDIVQPVTERGDEWVLTSQARSCLGGALATDVASVSVQDWVEERLRSGNAVTNREVVAATGADRQDVTALLRYLRQSGRAVIDPTGPGRGPGVRWIALGV
ncbi:RNA-binding domain-containing protein [Prescottella sp. R16]|uniref:RNA-binding domain-containing protein n=1 Tax=Prescottella sp. R16 TaxID=3064529 RepID=UPI00272E1FCD|nr:RNA-binding domain-containing protein [Prescottella sp. R16]